MTGRVGIHATATGVAGKQRSTERDVHYVARYVVATFTYATIVSAEA